MSPVEVVLLVVAGVVAGVVSVVAGLASLVSYPALLAAGLSPTAANTTNTVALVLTGLGSAAASRTELAGLRPVVVRLSLVTALGGGTGAALLLLGPPGAFEAVVPWLVGAASLVMLARPLLLRALGRDGPGAQRTAGTATTAVSGRAGTGARVALLAIAVYTGYFGAAGGVLVLAALSVLLDLSLHRTIAVKNVVSGVANAVAALAFAVLGPVAWGAAAALGAGFFVGGLLGPRLVRHLPAEPLRIAVAVAGLGVALGLGLGVLR